MIAAHGCRLPTGGLIDRSRVINFRFNGKSYRGYAGDSLASALLANGVSLTARSFKYHRPRGIMGAGIEEPSSFVELSGGDASGSEAITTVRLQEGLDARSVHCWPSPSHDVMSMNQLFSRLLPAAFYYKTFMWPGWRLFENLVRRAAGLASAPEGHTPRDRFEIRHGQCDVLVVGAGAAGIMAALTAARAGARVLIADAGSEPGGALLSHRGRIDGLRAPAWVAARVAELDSYQSVIRLRDATAWAYREHNLVLVTERSPQPAHLRRRTWRVRAGRVVLATGAIERPLVFPGNDRPGVMLASAVQTYVNRYAVRPGNRAVLFTNNDSAYPVAADMIAAGIDIAGIVDSRFDVSDAARSLVPDVEILPGQVVSGTAGHKRIRVVKVRSRTDGSERSLTCELLCTSGGWNPTVHLYSQSRGAIRYDERLATFLPAQPAQPAACAGGAAGVFALGEAMADGIAKGNLAAAARGFYAAVSKPPTVPVEPEYRIEPLWYVDPVKPSAMSFVDLQNDVTLNDVRLAVREGFGAVEHVKRYTTAGMGIDQGKTANVNVVGAIARLTDQSLADVGTTTFRSPYLPIEFGAVAGLREESVVVPYRHTPITRWNEEHGAVMYEAGARWRRPGYYPEPGETFQQTVTRECRAVRNAVAVYDGSPLGKFEIKGRDALALLDMLYTNRFSTLQPGMGRYGVMLSDDGLILDDGVTFRLGENHYWMSTSTAHADEVNRHMEHFLQIERPAWDVKITPVTSQWSNATICGPKARAVIELLGTDIDMSAQAFPSMALREGRVAGIDARVCRVSFTGELSFEVNVFSRHGAELWNKVLEAGRAHGLVAIGSEANHVLRVEKGFLSLGHEVDGTVDPIDLGMGWIMSPHKPDFIGKRAVEIRRSAGTPRRELVGLLIDDPQHLVPEGAPITPHGRTEASEGLVTACVWSVVKERTIALALLTDGRSRLGRQAHIRLPERIITAEITEPCFHDPQGLRLRS